MESSTYYAQHKKAMLATATQWQKNNKDQYNEYQRKYIAKLRCWNKIVKEFRFILLDGYY